MKNYLLIFLCVIFGNGGAEAQVFRTAEELIKPIAKARPAAGYVVAYGKVMAKRGASGVTTFDYADGKLTSEKLPNGVVGTYFYDRSGRFEGISYSDGRQVQLKYWK